ncbi:hypothetical protein VIOR3934_13642 [Vibrio orientalis CIP 102891 = ATCC 33934]|uniref:Uncharacterized protein n=2 Tax=Vibrio orientalis TaxID=28175 RepID=C9QKB0_VIBOR|nr:hypothetical protein VIA_002760 [Vibrio orientalis CIP 102891 = ATCC 33934]EGU45688.1 hypothetical protein VIOR3934_13642 [Vibrio orientalis CIP 102891 = ATCC 33934]
MFKVKLIVISLMLVWVMINKISLGVSNEVVEPAKAISGNCVKTLKTGTLLKLKVKTEAEIVPTTIGAIGLTCEVLLQKIISKDELMVKYKRFESGDIDSLKVSITEGRTYWGFNGEENTSD